MHEHELNSQGTGCAAGCLACGSAQWKKEHDETSWSYHSNPNVVDYPQDCPACQSFLKWLHNRLESLES